MNILLGITFVTGNGKGAAQGFYTRRLLYCFITRLFCPKMFFFFKSFKIADCSKENLTEMFNIIFSRLTAYTRDLSWDTTIKGFLPYWFPFGWLVGWSASLRPCLGLPMCQSNVPIPISISDNGCHDNAVSIGHKLWRTCPFYNCIWDFWRGGCDFDSGYHGRYRR